MISDANRRYCPSEGGEQLGCSQHGGQQWIIHLCQSLFWQSGLVQAAGVLMV